MLQDCLIKLKNLQQDIQSIKSLLNIKTLIAKNKSLGQELSIDWNNAKKTQEYVDTIKKINNLMTIETTYKNLLDWVTLTIEENEELPFNFSEAYKELEELIRQTKLDLMFKDKHDEKDVLLSITAGAGGKEAQDWAGMLLRMYIGWATKHNYKCDIIDFQSGEDASLCKSAILKITGTNIYGKLKYENGVHRLVRVSPFDAQNRRHTSFAAIEVIPLIEANNKVQIDSGDIQIDTYRSSGAGGQHVNKTESAIRITHIPTGLVVCCQNERSQHQNKKLALELLLSKLVKLQEEQFANELSEIKGEQKQIQWGSQIRSYVFMPYQMVKDHRTNYETSNINAVMDGNIDDFIYHSIYTKGI